MSTHWHIQLLSESVQLVLTVVKTDSDITTFYIFIMETNPVPNT